MLRGLKRQARNSSGTHAKTIRTILRFSNISVSTMPA